MNCDFNNCGCAAGGCGCTLESSADFGCGCTKPAAPSSCNCGCGCQQSCGCGCGCNKGCDGACAKIWKCNCLKKRIDELKKKIAELAAYLEAFPCDKLAACLVCEARRELACLEERYERECPKKCGCDHGCGCGCGN